MFIESISEDNFSKKTIEKKSARRAGARGRLKLPRQRPGRADAAQHRPAEEGPNPRPGVGDVGGDVKHYLPHPQHVQPQPGYFFLGRLLKERKMVRSVPYQSRTTRVINYGKENKKGKKGGLEKKKQTPATTTDLGRRILMGPGMKKKHFF